MNHKIKQTEKKKPKDPAVGRRGRDRSFVEKIASDWKDGMSAYQISRSRCIDIELVQWTIKQLETQGVRTSQR